MLRTRRAQARCTQPRATLSSRKQPRRPHEYLTPLLTAEAGQQWGRKDGATTMCLEPCLDKMCCVNNCMSKRVDDNTNAREFEPWLETGSSCGRQRCRATSGTAFEYAKPCGPNGSNSASTCIHSGPLCARQQHLLVPAPSEVEQAAASAVHKIGKQALHTSYTSKAWPKFLLADAAVSTPVFVPPLMPIHDTRLRFGGVMRFRTKRTSQRPLHRLPERSSICGEGDSSPWGLRNDSFAPTSRRTG